MVKFIYIKYIIIMEGICVYMLLGLIFFLIINLLVFFVVIFLLNSLMSLFYLC